MVEKTFTLPSFINKFSNYDGGINCVFINIFKMRFIFNYTTGEIAECFPSVNIRTIQRWFKSLGWELDRFETQQRIVDRNRRDYKSIRNKSKNTMMKNCFSSKPEEYIRQKLNFYLPTIIKDCEIIVGLNNVSILENGKEIDIPFIIIQNNTFHKFAVEYDGYYWHKNENNIKKTIIEDRNYTFFPIIEPKDIKSQDKLYEYIDKEIVKIGNKVVKIIQ